MAHANKDLKDIIICYISRYFNFFGVSTYFYDCKKQKIVRCSKTVTYCLILHISVAIVAPIALFKNYSILENYIYLLSPIAMQLGGCVAILNFLTTNIVIIKHWVHQSHIQRVFNDLNDIRVNELANIRKRVQCAQVDAKLFFSKLITTVIIVISTFCAPFLLYYTYNDTLVLAAAIYLTFTVNMAIAVQYQFCIGMLYGGYLLKVLNCCISQIVEDINDLCDCIPRYILLQNARLLCDELTEIGRIHTKLLKLTTGIKDIYQFQILFILIACFTSQVFVLFYLSVILTGVSVDMKQSQLLVGAFGTLTCVVDLFLLAFICGDAIRACNISGESLKMLTSQNILHAKLEKSIEALALQLTSEKMNLTICGLFDLDGNTGYMITKGAMMKLILLVQIDYDNFYLFSKRS